MALKVVDPNRLYPQLLNTGLQQKDNALYQVIYNLISQIININNIIVNISGGGGGGGSSTVVNLTTQIQQLLFDSGLGGDGDSFVIPGQTGATGATGATGPAGPSGSGSNSPIFIPDDPFNDDIIYAIPGPTGPAGGAGSAAWTLFGSSTPTGTTTVNFTGMGTPADIMVLAVGITLASLGAVIAQVSVDNGATYLNSSGDYVSIKGDGTKVDNGNFIFYSPTATAARYGALQIWGCNVAAPKIARATFFSVDGINLQYAPNTGQFNAIRVVSSGGNYTAGSIYVYTR